MSTCKALTWLLFRVDQHIPEKTNQIEYFYFKYIFLKKNGNKITKGFFINSR